MAQVRDVLGHVVVEDARGRRICHRNSKGHSIERGESCLVISDENGRAKNYCVVCAKDILKKASEKLTGLATGLRLPVK